MIVEIEWTPCKSKIDSGLSFKEIDQHGHYFIYIPEAPIVWLCKIYKDNGSDQTEYESQYQNKKDGIVKSNVVTASELNDKTLRTFCVFGVTDSNGEAVMSVKVPDGGRYIAYGDIEFEQRHFGDYVKNIEIVDYDRLVAWQIALSLDPNASEPVPDAVVQSNGYPIYPIIAHYDEKDYASMSNGNTSGTVKSGMAMTFQFGITEAQPVGGYGFIPGGFYLRIVAQKADGHGAGFKSQLSIDWAQANG